MLIVASDFNIDPTEEVMTKVDPGHEVDRDEETLTVPPKQFRFAFPLPSS